MIFAVLDGIWYIVDRDVVKEFARVGIIRLTKINDSMYLTEVTCAIH